MSASKEYIIRYGYTINIPTTYILIESIGKKEHRTHIGYINNIPIAYVLIKR